MAIKLDINELKRKIGNQEYLIERIVEKFDEIDERLNMIDQTMNDLLQ